MAVSAEQIEFALDLFADLGPLSTRKMMGGLCIYCDGVIFALADGDGSFHLKGAGDVAEAMEDEGWERWSYTRKTGKTTFMPYWRMPEALLDDPEALLDDPEEACAWARRALAVL